MLCNRLRVRSYRARPRFPEPVLWVEHVLGLARSINRLEMNTALRDCDVVRIAGRHAEWACEQLGHFQLYLYDRGIQA